MMYVPTSLNNGQRLIMQMHMEQLEKVIKDQQCQLDSFSVKSVTDEYAYYLLSIKDCSGELCSSTIAVNVNACTPHVTYLDFKEHLISKESNTLLIKGSDLLPMGIYCSPVRGV